MYPSTSPTKLASRKNFVRRKFLWSARNRMTAMLNINCAMILASWVWLRDGDDDKGRPGASRRARADLLSRGVRAARHHPLAHVFEVNRHSRRHYTDTPGNDYRSAPSRLYSNSSAPRPFRRLISELTGI